MMNLIIEKEKFLKDSIRTLGSEVIKKILPLLPDLNNIVIEYLNSEIIVKKWEFIVLRFKMFDEVDIPGGTILNGNNDSFSYEETVKEIIPKDVIKMDWFDNFETKEIKDTEGPLKSLLMYHVLNEVKSMNPMFYVEEKCDYENKMVLIIDVDLLHIIPLGDVEYNDTIFKVPFYINLQCASYDYHAIKGKFIKKSMIFPNELRKEISEYTYLYDKHPSLGCKGGVYIT